jgi:hypothetical protein
LRGECPENRIKEQQLDLFADRTSTGKMCSNQLRLYFSSITYVLMQRLRTALAGTELEKAQYWDHPGRTGNAYVSVPLTTPRVWRLQANPIDEKSGLEQSAYVLAKSCVDP